MSVLISVPIGMAMSQYLNLNHACEEVGLNHMHCWKSVNIRAIPKVTGKFPT